MWEIDSFSDQKFTVWGCSKCFTGALFVKKEPSITTNDHYSVRLKCSNSTCQEEYFSIGLVRYFSIIYKTEVSKKFYGEKRKQYYPKHFSPSLRLFQLNHFIPDDVKNCIDNSFDDFWSDQLSSANAIRRSLELLMDNLNVADKGKLHQRIENYKRINPSIANMLLAIKWIGNSGSHGETLTKDDLLDAYEILEVCLNELFPVVNRDSIIKIVDEINIIKKGRSQNM